MKTSEAYARVRAMLREAGVEDAGFDAGELFRHAAGVSRFAADEIGEDAWARLQALAARRAAREPLQYILGQWSFLDLELAVGPGVLCPRPETEEVCLAAAELLRQSGVKAPEALDLCAGSGAIALGLQSRCLAARIAAVEWDEAAFGWLSRNVAAFAAAHPGANAPAPLRADALEHHKTLAAASLDLIVSNPPYVSEAEYAGLAPEVHAEPRTALVAGEDGLAFYRAIARDYYEKLKPGGWLVFEIGADQGAAVAEFLAARGYEGAGEAEPAPGGASGEAALVSRYVRRDMAGHPRIAVGMRPMA